MKRDEMNPMPAIPAMTCQITATLSAKAARKGIFRSSGRELMRGIAEYTTPTPPGSWESMSGEIRLSSSFWRTTVLIVIPQTYINVLKRQYFRGLGRGSYRSKGAKIGEKR